MDVQKATPEDNGLRLRGIGSESELKTADKLDDTSGADGEKITADNKGVQLKVVDGQASQSILPRFVGDHLRVISKLGEGGMGYVYLAVDERLDKTFAVKVLKKELVCDATALKRFEQEADAAQIFTHPNLAALYAHGKDGNDTPYLVMEFLDGESLARTVEKDGFLEIDRSLNIFIQICEALEYCHAKGVVHRDLKPSNVILLSQPGKDFVKLVDFGIAKVVAGSNRQDITRTAEIIGSPIYMSPEQCQGDHVDFRSDIYSFGCLMYETLTGHPPFSGINPIKTVLQHLKEAPKPFAKTANPGVSPALEAIVMMCLEKKVDDRYQSVSDLQRDLELVREGQVPEQFRRKLKPNTVSLPVSMEERKYRPAIYKSLWFYEHLCASSVLIGVLLSITAWFNIAVYGYWLGWYGPLLFLGSLSFVYVSRIALKFRLLMEPLTTAVYDGAPVLVPVVLTPSWGGFRAAITYQLEQDLYKEQFQLAVDSKVRAEMKKLADGRRRVLEVVISPETGKPVGLVLNQARVPLLPPPQAVWIDRSFFSNHDPAFKLLRKRTVARAIDALVVASFTFALSLLCVPFVAHRSDVLLLLLCGLPFLAAVYRCFWPTALMIPWIVLAIRLINISGSTNSGISPLLMGLLICNIPLTSWLYSLIMAMLPAGNTIGQKKMGLSVEYPKRLRRIVASVIVRPMQQLTLYSLLLLAYLAMLLILSIDPSQLGTYVYWNAEALCILQIFVDLIPIWLGFGKPLHDLLSTKVTVVEIDSKLQISQSRTTISARRSN